MSKIICAYSGVEFQCEHLPLYISSRDVYHPLFNVSKKKLLSLASSWSLNKLTPTESYLTYLSLLHATGLIEWRVPASYHAKTPQIIANNMESLLHIIGKIDVITHPSFVLPHFVISPDTCNLENTYHWIQIWNQNYNDWHDGIKSHANDQELTRRENSLNKLIKTSHKNIEDYPSILAQWARIAGDFPTFKVRIRGVETTLADYWEDIIIKCAKEVTAFNIPENDLAELIDHCEDNIANEGSLYSTALMRFLRRGQAMQKGFLGDIGEPTLTAYRILTPETSAADANIQNMIDNAPTIEPQKKNYKSILDYVKAKAKWNMAQNYQILKNTGEIV